MREDEDEPDVEEIVFASTNLLQLGKDAWDDSALNDAFERDLVVYKMLHPEQGGDICPATNKPYHESRFWQPDKFYCNRGNYKKKKKRKKKKKVVPDEEIPVPASERHLYDRTMPRQSSFGSTTGSGPRGAGKQYTQRRSREHDKFSSRSHARTITTQGVTELPLAQFPACSIGAPDRQPPWEAETPQQSGPSSEVPRDHASGHLRKSALRNMPSRPSQQQQTLEHAPGHPATHSTGYRSPPVQSTGQSMPRPESLLGPRSLNRSQAAAPDSAAPPPPWGYTSRRSNSSLTTPYQGAAATMPGMPMVSYQVPPQTQNQPQQYGYPPGAYPATYQYPYQYPMVGGYYYSPPGYYPPPMPVPAAPMAYMPPFAHYGAPMLYPGMTQAMSGLQVAQPGQTPVSSAAAVYQPHVGHAGPAGVPVEAPRLPVLLRRSVAMQPLQQRMPTSGVMPTQQQMSPSMPDNGMQPLQPSIPATSGAIPAQPQMSDNVMQPQQMPATASMMPTNQQMYTMATMASQHNPYLQGQLQQLTGAQPGPPNITAGISAVAGNPNMQQDLAKLLGTWYQSGYNKGVEDRVNTSPG